MQLYKLLKSWTYSWISNGTCASEIIGEKITAHMSWSNKNWVQKSLPSTRINGRMCRRHLICDANIIKMLHAVGMRHYMIKSPVCLNYYHELQTVIWVLVSQYWYENDCIAPLILSMVTSFRSKMILFKNKLVWSGTIPSKRTCMASSGICFVISKSSRFCRILLLLQQRQ